MDPRIQFFALLVILCTTISHANTSAGSENGTAASVEVQTEKEETFQEFEGRMKKGMNSLIRRVLPHLMEGASKSDVSGPCVSSLMKIIGGMRQLKEWALRFIDATGKLPPGVLEGTSLSLGDYDECLDIKVGKKENPPLRSEDVLFQGKYCLIESHRPDVLAKAIKEYQDGNKDAPIAKTKTVLSMFVRYKHLTNTTMKLGVCIPSTCREEDLQNILNAEALRVIGRLEVAYCEPDNTRELSAEQYVILGIFGFAVGCLILGTFADVFLRLRGEEKDTTKKKVKENSSTSFTDMVRTVSLYSNAVELLDTSRVHEPIRTLCAIRVITVLLTIYSHTYGHIHELHFQKFSKPANFLKFFDSFTFSGIANGSVAMDTVIFVAGITITYPRWRNVSEKGRVKLNAFKLLVQRYVRMSALQLLVISLFLLLPMVGTGPLWAAYLKEPVRNCQERWWLNLLYIGNFWSARNTCLYQTWVLAVIMQLSILSVFFLYLLRWSPKAGACFAAVLTLAGVIGVATMTIIHDLPGSMAFFMLDIRTGPLTWRRVYTLAYDHFGPFCIGMLTGYFLGVKKNTLNISKRTSILLWCASISCSSAVLFGLYSYRNGAKIDLSLATFYAVMHRNVWALCIAWLVVACTTNHGGVATKVMEANCFLIMDRLCYLVFLLHIPLMYFHSGSIRERWFMGHFELMFYAIGYMVLSFLLAFVLHISFVKPYYFIESYVSSYFGERKSISSHQASPLSTMSFGLSSSSGSEHVNDAEGCVNLGYSKTANGV